MITTGGSPISATSPKSMALKLSISSCGAKTLTFMRLLSMLNRSLSAGPLKERNFRKSSGPPTMPCGNYSLLTKKEITISSLKKSLPWKTLMPSAAMSQRTPWSTFIAGWSNNMSTAENQNGLTAMSFTSSNPIRTIPSSCSITAPFRSSTVRMRWKRKTGSCTSGRNPKILSTALNNSWNVIMNFSMK